MARVRHLVINIARGTFFRHVNGFFSRGEGEYCVCAEFGGRESALFGTSWVRFFGVGIDVLKEFPVIAD